MDYPNIPVWKEAPFIRLIVPFICGILLQWYIGFPVLLYWPIAIICIALIFLFVYIKSFIQFRRYWLTGILINLLILCNGGLITYYCEKDHQSKLFIDLEEKDISVIVSLQEPLCEKNKSFKANAVINYIYRNDSFFSARETIILYFEKHDFLKEINHNSRIAFSKHLQAIRNPGNPGAFDFQRYCAFQGIHYQAYLKMDDFIVLKESDKNTFRHFLISVRQKIVSILRNNIKGEDEAGLAEALLIGYKDDLDKNLVELYANTGVVHIIAISGLHIGLIYWLLAQVFQRFTRQVSMKWIRALAMIGGLWLFGFVAGGSPSVLRSVIMFTFIIIGENTGKKTAIYNSLGASAFLLLCYNPFWLWDIGFQLSFIAVLSIAIFMKPVYNGFFTENKLIDLIWKLVATCIAAQILTTPISIFHFHQFPNYFLITNLVAVPLSSLIILVELLLCAFSFNIIIANASGWIVSYLISLMNKFVAHVERLPFSTLNGLQLSIPQAILIYIVIASTCFWIARKNKPALVFALCCLAFLSAIRTIVYIQASNQRKLIVYNIPQHRAIDLIQGRQCYFIGDPGVEKKSSLKKFHIEPTRNLYHVSETNANLKISSGRGFHFANKTILIIDSPVTITTGSLILSADIVIFSGNPVVHIPTLIKNVNCRLIIFDSSNAAWKINKWKKDCEVYGIKNYSVQEKGAFILNTN